MEGFLAFSVAVLGLLAVPGPTNTLLATAGAAGGFPRSLRLLPAEIGGYLVAIGFLTQVVRPLVAGFPTLPLIVRTLAAGYLVWLAFRLWRDPRSATEVSSNSPIKIADVFLTTLLNPKALIFAFVIFPEGTAWELLPRALVFSVLVVSCGGVWIALGAAIRRSSNEYVTKRLVARTSATVLFGFAVFFAVSIILSTPQF